MAVVASTPFEGICDISVAPWDSSIRTAASPSVIVFTLAMGWYYLVGLFRQGGQTAILALIPFFFITGLAGIQTYVIATQPQCPPWQILGLITAWIVGILSGAIGYGGASLSQIQNLVPVISSKEGFAQTGAITAFTSPAQNATSPNAIVQSYNVTGTPTAAKSAAVDDDTYLVDIYKNGKLVTQSIGESVIG